MSLHIEAEKNQIAERVLMPGDPLRAKFIAENFLESAVCYNKIRNMFGFTGIYKGVKVSVQGSGMGMPSMGIYSHELFNDYDVNSIIRIGTAGAFKDDIKIKDTVAIIAASTDSNYQHAFGLSGNYSPAASFEMLKKLLIASEKTGIPFKGGNMLSADVFYEYGDWWKPWYDMGLVGVEMEAAALYMNAARAGKDALAIVTISDHFITGEKATAEERQNSFTDMMNLALEAAVQ